MMKYFLMYGGATMIGAAVTFPLGVLICVGVVAILHGIALVIEEEEK